MIDIDSRNALGNRMHWLHARTRAHTEGARRRERQRRVCVKTRTSHPSFQCADPLGISSAGTPETIGQDQSAQGEHCWSEPQVLIVSIGVLSYQL